MALITQIAARASACAKAIGFDYPVSEATMDIEAAHCNGCPLDLNLFSLLSEQDFNHDTFGIRKHINRSTGVLEDCFVPRCAETNSVIAKG